MTKDEALNHLKAITEAFGPDAGIELDQKAWSKLHTAIKDALAQPERLAELGWQEIDCPICGGGARAFPKPEQEPMAWIERDMQCDDFDPDSVTCEKPTIAADGWEWVALYTTPPPQYKEPEQEWKLVPVEPTNEMLKAMDECSTEGYDERLLAGHAASVYMAAVDVAPTPPQRQEPKHEPVAWMYPDEYERMTTSETFCTVYSVKVGSATRGESTVALYTSPPPKRPWVGLKKEDMPDGKDPMFDHPYFIAGMVYAHNKLLEKNK